MDRMRYSLKRLLKTGLFVFMAELGIVAQTNISGLLHRGSINLKLFNNSHLLLKEVPMAI